MHYLTVPDLLWINLQLTGSPQAYDFATLEEGTFYQYGHGGSTDLNAQAIRLLTGFKKLAPFAAGNEATAFTAMAAFLEMNGQRLSTPDGAVSEWLASPNLDGQTSGHERHDRFGVPDTHEIVAGVIARYPQFLSSLAAETAVV